MHLHRDLLDALIEWLAHPPARNEDAVEIQRYCIAMGLTLRDAWMVHEVNPEEPLSAHVPRHFSASGFTWDDIQRLTAICATAFPPPPAPRPAVQKPVNAAIVQVQTEDATTQAGLGSTSTSAGEDADVTMVDVLGKPEPQRRQGRSGGRKRTHSVAVAGPSTSTKPAGPVLPAGAAADPVKQRTQVAQPRVPEESVGGIPAEEQSGAQAKEASPIAKHVRARRAARR